MQALMRELIDNSKWSYPAFDGKLIVEGRILSPVEAQAVGISSALIASGIANKEDLLTIQKIGKNETTVNEDNADELFNALKNFDADKILKMAENQDKVLCKCISRASMDKGEKWQNFTVVLDEKKQCAKNNRLWVGMFSEEDRKNMIELCLIGHKKAAEALRRAL
jgi:hypothetical protein